MKLTEKLLLSATCLMIGAGAQAATMTIGGTLAGYEGVAPSAGEPLSLTGAPYDFQAGFVDEDDAGGFRFDFKNTLTSLAMITVASFTINQNPNGSSGLLFEDGVTTEFGDMVRTTLEGDVSSYFMQAMVDAGDTISLIIDYGNPVGSGNVGPDIDFTVTATPVPVPAAMPLLAAGLGALGFVARRRKKASAA